MDAVSRLIYWQGDPARGVNGDTLEFLKNMNHGLKARHPSALLIAEDSTAYPGVTRPVDEGGLGFDYKWDLGWMHDTLEFCQTQPDLRPRDHGKLLWSMHYFSKRALPAAALARRGCARQGGNRAENVGRGRMRQVCAGACDVSVYVHASG